MTVSPVPDGISEVSYASEEPLGTVRNVPVTAFVPTSTPFFQSFAVP
jgi:hypothetical protein